MHYRIQQGELVLTLELPDGAPIPDIDIDFHPSTMRGDTAETDAAVIELLGGLPEFDQIRATQRWATVQRAMGSDHSPPHVKFTLYLAGSEEPSADPYLARLADEQVKARLAAEPAAS